MRWCKINYKLEHMKNTIENKLKFYGLFIGQEVYFFESKIERITPYLLHKDYGMGFLMEAHLELKPLSSISDEDAIEVAKIICNSSSFKQLEIVIDAPENRHEDVTYVLVKRFINHPEVMEWIEFALIQIDHDGCDVITGIKDKSGEFKDDFTDNYIHVTDFLRSKSYAVGFHNLSVSDLENYGWIKLIK